jgi:hypothetical protein
MHSRYPAGVYSQKFRDIRSSSKRVSSVHNETDKFWIRIFNQVLDFVLSALKLGRVIVICH